MSYFDENLKNTLNKKGISFATLSEIDQLTLTDQVQKRFTFTGNKIDWSTLESAVNLSSLGKQTALAKISDRLVEMKIDNIIFLGDSAIDHAYVIELTDIKSAIRIFSEIPQHTYIFPENLCWIACLSFEGHIDYADLRNADLAHL